MRAVLFSQFVPRFLEHAVLPRLRARGIDVVATVDPSRSTLLPRQADDTAEEALDRIAKYAETH